jgi:ABC-type Fe3+-hydroxamate transport system substrate-binding protein
MQFTDQMGNTVYVPQKPRRIVSLVPSQSEYLWELGLQKELIGITKFCIHPAQMFETVCRVGGTKQLQIEKIKQLQPDLIIGNKEENVREQIEELQKDFPVWMSDVNTLKDAYEMMLSLGELCGKKTESEALVTDIQNRMQQVKGLFEGIKTAYLIWHNPYMAAAGATFIDSVLNYAGFVNVFQEQTRYPEVSVNDLANNQADLVLLSSEPYPFNEKHQKELEKVLSGAKVMLADGELFSWYGNRLVSLPDYLMNLKKSLA